MTSSPRKVPTFRERLLRDVFPVLALILLLGVVACSCDQLLPPLRTSPATTTPTPVPRPTLAPLTPSVVTPLPSAKPSPTAVPRVAPTLSLDAAEVTLDAANTDRYAWPEGALLHPHGLVVLSDTAYMVDAGQVVALALPRATARRLLPPEGRIEDIPIGELFYLALSPDGAGLLLLDKRGDVYWYDIAGDTWHIERPIDKRRTSPNPVPLAVASYDGHAYILDTTYSQVWRYPFDDVAEGYLPGGSGPEKRSGTAYDITRGVDLAAAQDVYVLIHPWRAEPAGLRRYVGSTPESDKAFAAGLELDNPTRLFLDPQGQGPLYLLDQAGHRLRALDRTSGVVLQTLTFGEAVEMRAVYTAGGYLYIAAPDAVYAYPGTGQQYSVSGGAGPDPAGRPDNLANWRPALGITSPLAGVRFLPERDSLLPGATRIYRYGIHHGLDMYEDVMGVDVPYAAPVRAIADGVVRRADQDYVEVSPARFNELVALCARLHLTPPDVENVFRGRQVWIDHGDGVMSHYAHLSRIPDDVVSGTQVLRGQVIGYIGNSGTSDGASGTRNGVHLHFEIYLREHYLGEGLSLWETRQLLQQVFFP